MGTKWEKFIKKNRFWIDLQTIIDDIHDNKLDCYFCRPIKWHKNTFRIRKWNIRIIFQTWEKENKILAVDTRWQIYKSLK